MYKPSFQVVAVQCLAWRRNTAGELPAEPVGTGELSGEGAAQAWAQGEGRWEEAEGECLRSGEREGGELCPGSVDAKDCHGVCTGIISECVLNPVGIVFL